MVTEISLLASVAQSATTTGGANTFDNIRSLADDAEAEATALYRDLEIKQGEITSLTAQLNACFEGAPVPYSTPAPFLAEESTPTSSPEQPVPVEPTPAPTPAPMPTQDEEEDGDQSPSKWVPRIGDTWNYNLDTPVDTSAHVDVFFIDMGKFSLNMRAIGSVQLVYQRYPGTGNGEPTA